MAKPTIDDAKLMVDLLQWWAMIDLNSANNWMWSEAFVPEYEAFLTKYPVGSEGYGQLMKILGAMESLGTLVKNDLLNADLVHDWLATYLVWNRVGGIALGLRESIGQPRLYENFEWLAKKSAG